MKKYSIYFIDMPLNVEMIPFYVVRTLLQKAVDKNMMRFKGTIVDLGCGEMPYKQYILDHNKNVARYVGIDLPQESIHEHYSVNKPDYIWDGIHIPLEDQSADIILATELFEHVSNLDKILLEAKRVLKNEGELFFTVPFLWNLHLTPYDFYRYTPYALKEKLQKAGYSSIHIGILGGHHAALAQMLGIWIGIVQQHRTGFSKKLFYLFIKFIACPVTKFLMKLDAKRSDDSYQEGTMLTGLYGYAKK